MLSIKFSLRKLFHKTKMNPKCEELHKNVQDYYENQIACKDDVKSTVKCCLKQNLKQKDIRKLIHEEVQNKNYGCGLLVPEEIKGLNILDLGCGAGLDCFTLSKLAGPDSIITGVDMTDAQLKTANEYVEYHRSVFEYEKANTIFKKGNIEDLSTAGIPCNSQDIIVSNGVINLTSDKRKTLTEAFRVLKNGGEMYFSDYYCDQIMPKELKDNKVLWGECISGALQWEQIYNIAQEVGFCTPIQVEVSPIDINDSALCALIEGYRFVSVTYRLFKCQDGTINDPVFASYIGGLEDCEESFTFGSSFIFNKNIPQLIPSEIGNILNQSRFNRYFRLTTQGATECKTVVKMNPFC